MDVTSKKHHSFHTKVNTPFNIQKHWSTISYKGEFMLEQGMPIENQPRVQELTNGVGVKSPPLKLNQLLNGVVSLQTLQWLIEFMFLIVKMGRGFGTVYFIYLSFVNCVRVLELQIACTFCSSIMRTRFVFLSYMSHDMSGWG